MSVFSLFFTVLWQYNDYVHYIEPCFKGILVQADRDNREVSVLHSQGSHPGWEASVKTAVQCSAHHGAPGKSKARQWFPWTQVHPLVSLILGTAF